MNSLVGVLLALAVAGCGGGAPPAQPPAPVQPAAKQEGAAAQPASARQQELAKLVEGAKAEGKVVWWDGFKPEEADPVIKAFQQKYPFIQVEHARVSDTDSRERLLRELLAGIANTDVFDLSSELIPNFMQAGVLEDYDWSKAFDIRPEQRDQPGLVTVTASVKGIGFNTNQVKKEDAPKTWEELLDPKWQGKKLTVDSRPNTFVHLIPAWGEDKVMDFLTKLAAQQPQFRRGQTETIQLMAAGEVGLLAGTYNHSLLLVADKGAPIDYVQPEPVPVSLDDYGIPRKAPHPNAAKLLLGWLATEGNKVVDDVTHRGIPLPGFDTRPARLAAGKKLSIFSGQWIARDAELMDKAVKALGVQR